MAGLISLGGRDDFATGQALAVAGTTPTICVEAAATSAGLDLMEEAGLPRDFPVRVYQDAAEYQARLDEAHQAGERVVMKHLHPHDMVPGAACWMDRDLVGFLNNKGNLLALVPAEAVPCRRLVSAAEVRNLADRGTDVPAVIKVSSDLPSGGGYGVALCRTVRDLYRALERFGETDGLVMEEYLPIQRNLCLNYATHANRISYLGGSEQVVDEAGAYLGNWLEATPLSSQAVAVGQAIMENAVRRGYRGVAGFDMAVLADGRVKVLDLNFRPNGSTPALLYQPALTEVIGPEFVGRLATWSGSGPFGVMLSAARRALRVGWLLPLATLHPRRAGECPRLRGLLLGTTRDEVEAKNRQLAQWGMIRADAAPAAMGAARAA